MTLIWFVKVRPRHRPRRTRRALTSTRLADRQRGPSSISTRPARVARDCRLCRAPRPSARPPHRPSIDSDSNATSCSTFFLLLFYTQTNLDRLNLRGTNKREIGENFRKVLETFFLFRCWFFGNFSPIWRLKNSHDSNI
jgi:hypothetical protein